VCLTNCSGISEGIRWLDSDLNIKKQFHYLFYLNRPISDKTKETDEIKNENNETLNATL